MSDDRKVAGLTSDDLTHTHQFPEEQEPSGRLILAPCLICNEAALDAMDAIRVERDQAVYGPPDDELVRRLYRAASTTNQAGLDGSLLEQAADEIRRLRARNGGSAP